MNEKEIRSVILKYYAFQFCFSMLLWVPIFVEFQKMSGLTQAEIFRIQSVYYIAFAALEIPTGMGADIFGYRTCLILGGAILTAANVLPVVSRDYDAFFMHFMLIALARSLISGASSAYVYEFVGKHKNTAAYKEIEGKARAIGLYGKVVCWGLVGYLMVWNFTSPYWITAIFSALSFIFAYTLPTVKPSIQSSGRVLSGLIDVSRSLASSKRLVYIMLQGVGMFVLVRIYQVNLFQPILSKKGFAVETFGLAMAGMTIFEAIGSSYSHYLKKYLTDLRATLFFTVIMGGCVMLTPFLNQATAIIALFLFSLSAGLSFPIQRQLVNDNIKNSSKRASLLSIESILDRSICAVAASYLSGTIQNGFDSYMIWIGLLTIVAVTICSLGAKART